MVLKSGFLNMLYVMYPVVASCVYTYVRRRVWTWDTAALFAYLIVTATIDFIKIGYKHFERCLGRAYCIKLVST